MEDRLVPAMARIKNASGNVVGVGLLVYPRGVLTCAHVVNQALGRPSNSLPKPAEQEALYLDFPTSLPGTTFTAKVALWSPLAQLPDGVYDIAGLTLAEAVPGILPMRLVDAGDLADHPFHAYGFPPGHDAGVWVKGRIVGKRVSGWFQLEAGGTSVYSLREGFSGGPVWDETVKGVVGIVAEADSAIRGKSAAGMIPARALLKAWPELRSYVRRLRRARNLLSAGLASLAGGVLLAAWLALTPIADLYNRRGLEQLNNLQTNEAVTSFQRAARLNSLRPSNPAIPYNLAAALEDAFRDEEALNYYRQALALDEGFYPAYNNLARLYLLQNRPEDALALLDRAYRLVERQAELHLERAVILKNRGWAHLEQGSYALARRDLEHAIALREESPAAYCLLAQVYEAQGQEAKEQWRRCISYDTRGETVEARWRSLARERLGGP